MADIKRTIFNTSNLIRLLWLLCLLLSTNVTHASWNHKNVMGASECAECHEYEVDVWKKTAHQKNFRALSKNKDAKKIAEKMGVKRIKRDAAMCSSCHYTVGNKNGKIKIVAGVSCESCHSPAKDWIQVHNDYGGKGVNKKTESASHKKTRYKKLESLNMIRPDNTYGWVKNCLNCHIVANEKLVNIGGHKAGSDFKLSKRTQGKIRHYPKADLATLQYYNLISFATELEVSLAALSNASDGKYATEMQKRAKSSLANLKKANTKTPNDYAKKIISLANKTNIKPGNKQLNRVSKSISVNIMQIVQKKTGYVYDRNKLNRVPQTIAKTDKAKAAPIKKTIRNTSPKKTLTNQTKTTTKSIVPKTAKPIANRPQKEIKKTIATVAPVQSPKVSKNIDLSTTSNDPLIKEFSIFIPGNYALCETYTPWALGKQKLKVNSIITQGGCFGINVKASRAAQLYVLLESTNNSLIRLIPNNCNYSGINYNALSANQVTVIPNPSYSNTSIAMVEFPGYNKLYVILADNAYANSELSRLSASTPSICEFDKSATETIGITQDLAGMLNAIKKSVNEHMDWRMQNLQ